MNKFVVLVFIASLFLIANFYNYAINLELLDQNVFGFYNNKLENIRRTVSLNLNKFKGYQFEYKILEKSMVMPNPHDFEYLINSDYKICGYGKKWSAQAPLLLALVISSPDHFERRLAIRGTWSNRSLFPQMRSVFLIGDSQNKTKNEKIKKENEIFGDIVQESFIDSYNNLTLKTVMGLKWASKYCSQAKFFLKVDDDVLVNSHYIIGYLESMINLTEPLTNTFMCLVHRNATVKRNPYNKYYMSYEEFGEDYYKTYCGGGAYVFTSDLAQLLYDRSLHTRKIRMEDAYVGLLAHRLNSSFIDLKTHFCWHGSCRVAFKNISNFYFFYLKNSNEFYNGWMLVSQYVSKI